MKININKSFFLFLFPSILLFGCSQPNNNIDLSDLPIIKQKEVVDTKKENKNEVNFDEFIEDLVPLKTSEKILSKFKIGKKDPFSKGGSQFNQFSSNFKLIGFLNTEEEIYVFVKYLGNEGIISEDSIGGLNTKFLPDGAKVININTKSSQLKISYDNEDYIFEL